MFLTCPFSSWLYQPPPGRTALLSAAVVERCPLDARPPPSTALETDWTPFGLTFAAAAAATAAAAAAGAAFHIPELGGGGRYYLNGVDAFRLKLWFDPAKVAHLRPPEKEEPPAPAPGAEGPEEPKGLEEPKGPALEIDAGAVTAAAGAGPEGGGARAVATP